MAKLFLGTREVTPAIVTTNGSIRNNEWVISSNDLEDPVWQSEHHIHGIIHDPNDIVVLPIVFHIPQFFEGFYAIDNNTEYQGVTWSIENDGGVIVLTLEFNDWWQEIYINTQS